MSQQDSSGTNFDECEWPIDEGIWMAFIEQIGWFPLRTKQLRDDLGSGQCLAILAQFPVSATNWPFTFKGCHPAKRWRRPNDEELAKAETFYGVVATS